MSALFDLLLSWLLALGCWSPIGLWAIAKLDSELKERPVHNFIVATLVGAAINATVLGVFSFWMPITAKVSIWLAVSGTVLFLPRFLQGQLKVFASIRLWPALSWLGLVGIGLIAILCSLHTSLNNDSGLYYIQFMKWMNSYPVIPGLANLHDRLGFNSHWHLLSAAFDLGTLGRSTTNDLNGLLFLLVGIGSLESASRLSSRSSIFNLVWALMPLTFFMLVRFLTSTAPDLPSALIPLVYLSLIMDIDEHRPKLTVLAILIAFAATIKVLSVLHILMLLPLLFWSIAQKEFKSLVLAIFIGLVVLSPWVGRNVVQTGYLIFPMESVDLLHVDWKVPNDLAANARKMVDIHARTGTYDLSRYAAPSSEWLGFWYSVQSKSVLLLFGFSAMAALLLLLYGLVLAAKNRAERSTVLSITLAMLVLISFGFWWQSGPNPRFIYGIVFFFSMYVLATILGKMGSILRFAPLVGLMLMAVITRSVLTDEGPKRPSEFDSFEVGSLQVHYPSGTDKCWEHELPCTTHKRTDLVPRGKDLSDGFKNAQAQP